MGRRPLTLAGLVAAGLVGFAASGGAAPAQTYRTVYAGADLSIPIETYRERQFARTVRQETDFSCGSASVATLLTYHYDIPATERDVFQAMWEAGEQEAIRERGFSLLDMKRYLESRGLVADGYTMSLDKLAEIGVPAIALIDHNGYKHFVVIKGLVGDRILIGDPSAGLLIRSVEEFTGMWDGTVFFIRSFPERGRANWNVPKDWAAHPRGRPSDGPDFPTLQARQLNRQRAFDSVFGISGLF